MAEITPTRPSPLPLLCWFVAAALVCALLDVAQLVRASGGQATLRLVALILSAYAVAGTLTGAAAATAAHLGSAGPPRLAGLWSAGIVGWLFVFVVAYVNIVHLPSITRPVTWISNLLIAGAGLWGGRSLARSRLARWGASSLPSALTVLTIASLLALGVSATANRPTPDPLVDRTRAVGPNVLLIVIDTLRFDRTGGADPANSKTPVLDRLAAEGTSFTWAFAQASWTKPSAASIFTSLYPSTHQANLRRDRLGDEATTLPGAMSAAGYQTAVFSANPWISPAFGFDRGVDFFFEAERESFSRFVVLWRLIKALDRPLSRKPGAALLSWSEHLYRVRTPHRTNCERDGALVAALGQWLEEAGNTPWFAYLHLMSPHIPYEPPRATADFLAADQVALLQATSALPPQRYERLLELYDGAVTHGDSVLGRILELLRQTGRYENTVIAITADHGEEFHEHGRWGHGKSLYDEVVRVPLVLRGPDVPRGRIEHRPAMLVDIMPTIVRLAGGLPQPSWEGSDLRSLPSDRPAYAELIREGGLESFMLYRTPYKYLETVEALGESPRHELFDLASDPDERFPRNAAETTPWRTAVAATREAARSKRGTRQRHGAIDDAAEDRLRALGYVN